MPTPTIDPRVLQALAAGQDINQFGYMASPYQNMGEWTGGESGGYLNPGPKQTLLYQDIGNNTTNVFDEQGNFAGLSSGDSDSRMLGKFIASALAMYAGGQMMGGSPTGAEMGGAAAGGGGGAAGGAAGGVGGAGGSITGLTSAEIAASNAAATAGLSGNVAALAPVNLGTAGMTAAGSAGLLDTISQAASNPSNWARAAATTGLNSMRQGEIADYSTNGSLPGSAAVDYGDRSGNWLTRAMTDPKNWARLAGGLAGAADAGDQSTLQTATKEPWGPAQGLLKDMIGQTQAMSQRYQQQPFSDAQQQAYGNVAGLLNGINGGTPGLLQGMNANSSGANNYDRNNPRRQLTGSAMQAPTFGLLNPDFTRFGG